MPRIQFQVVGEDGRQRRADLDGDVLTFGRDADNALVVAGKFVSRRHGEIRFADGQWQIDNQSPNGTEVNGRKVGRKARVLADHDVVSVGGQALFEVRFDEAALAVSAADAAAVPDEGANAASASAKSGAGKKRLWIGIGIYLALMLLVFLFMSTLDTRDDGVRQPPQLTRAKIEAEIHARPTGLPIDARAANQSLSRARELYNRLDSSTDALYQAYVQYQYALAYSGRDQLEEGLDQRRYLDIQAKLIEEVYTQYDDAYKRVRNRDLAAAAKAFVELQRFYPNHSGEVYSNIEQQRRYIQQQAKKTRTR